MSWSLNVSKETNQLEGTNVEKDNMFKIPDNVQSDECIKFLRIVAVYVYEMYQVVMRGREGIG